jgi:hypothetical protein
MSSSGFVPTIPASEQPQTRVLNPAATGRAGVLDTQQKQEYLIPNINYYDYCYICMRWAGNVARMGEGRDVYRVLVGKPEGRRPVGRPRRRWEYNIRMDLGEVGCGYVDWM